jgi:hypothetical protein
MTTATAMYETDRFGRGMRRSLAIGVLALAVYFVGGLGDPVEFFRAYLPAYLFVVGVTLGSMALLMIYHLTGGAWGYLIRRILEASMRTMPLVAVMFTPIAYGIHYLYPFAQPETVAANTQLQHETFYLTPQLFWLRAAGYFAAWLIIASFLSAWSFRQDDSASPRLAWKCRQLSGPGAVVYGITLHFAAVDWAMSIMPAFHSSIWGPLFALGQLLSALAFALIVLACVVARQRAQVVAGPVFPSSPAAISSDGSPARTATVPTLSELVSRQALGDMGSLLLTFVIAWAYMAWFQFMLIWIANLPQDIIYYLPRSTPAWQSVTWAIVLLHFAAPFFLLLMRPVKRSIRALSAVAALLLAMQLLYVYFQITPSFYAALSADAQPGLVDGVGQLLRAHWMNFAAPIALGGIWLALFLWLLGSRPLIVLRDPHQAAAVRLLRLDEEEAAREKEVDHE